MAFYLVLLMRERKNLTEFFYCFHIVFQKKASFFNGAFLLVIGEMNALFFLEKTFQRYTGWMRFLQWKVIAIHYLLIIFR